MNNRGFTMAEVVVSIVVISVGALGIAKSTAGMSRMVNDGHQMTEASLNSQEVIERLRSLRCSSVTSGTAAPTPHIALAWTVTDLVNTKVVDLVTSYRTSSGYRADTVQASVPCV